MKLSTSFQTFVTFPNTEKVWIFCLFNSRTEWHFGICFENERIEYYKERKKLFNIWGKKEEEEKRHVYA